MKRILSTISLAMAVMLLAQIAAQAQVSCGFDRAAFSIENRTGVTLIYYVRWGNNSQWEKKTLKSGYVNTHWSLVDGIMGTSPTPYVKFDRIGGDGNFTAKEHRLKTYTIDPICSKRPKRGEPKHYVFRYSENGADLNLYAMREETQSGN